MVTLLYKKNGGRRQEVLLNVVEVNFVQYNRHNTINQLDKTRYDGAAEWCHINDKFSTKYAILRTNSPAKYTLNR